jgi:signal peptidase
MKKAVEYLGFIIVVIIMVSAVLTYLAPHFGWRVDAVLSGSMEPQLKVGSLVVTRPVEPEEIEVGDIITFRPTTVGENLISHRVVGIAGNSPLQFETMGDASDKPDPFTVPAQNLVGEICFHVPSVGYFTEFLKTPVGFLFGMVIPGLIIIALYISNIWRAITGDSKQRPEEVAKK